MAIFIMLPQYSPFTYCILDFIHCNIEQMIYRCARFVFMLEFITEMSASTTYQATEDLIGSFIPWLCMATSLSIIAIVGRLINSITFYSSILPKLWMLGSDHRSISEILSDPT